MLTYTITLSQKQWLVLKDILSRRVECLDNEKFQRTFTVPEIMETRGIFLKLLRAHPNKEEGKNDG